MNDGILALKVPKTVHVIAYADELAVMTTARYETDLERDTNETL